MKVGEGVEPDLTAGNQFIADVVKDFVDDQGNGLPGLPDPALDKPGQICS